MVSLGGVAAGPPLSRDSLGSRHRPRGTTVEPLKFDFPFERAEWAQAARAISLETIRRRWWRVAIFPALMVALAVAGFTKTLREGAPPAVVLQAVVPWIGLMIIWIGWLGLGYVLGPWRAARRVARMNSAFLGQTTLVITGTGLKVVSPGVTKDLECKAIPRVVETRQFFLFFVSGATAHFLPKRLLSDSQQGQLRVLLQGALPEGDLRLLP